MSRKKRDFTINFKPTYIVVGDERSGTTVDDGAIVDDKRGKVSMVNRTTKRLENKMEEKNFVFLVQQAVLNDIPNLLAF